MPDPILLESLGANTNILKLPPHSIEAEQSVLGGLMLDNSAWDQVADRITEEDFYRRDHRLIFRAIQQLAEKGNPLDVITLSEWLEQRQMLEEVGGLAYVGGLAKNTPSAANIRAYADIVRERSVLRQLIRVGTEISNSALQPEGQDSKTLLDEAEKRVFQIAEQVLRNRRGFRAIKELLVKAVDRIDTLFQQDNSITGVATGFTDLDERTAGLQPSDLIIIAGRPSMGKCIVSGSRILDPETGRLQTIDDMVGRRGGCLVTLDDAYKLRPATPCDYLDDGIKPVFRVRTVLGRELTTTLTHPFLTLGGWKPLSTLQLGERIAVPRILPYFGNAQLADAQVKLMAYFLADGCLTQTVPKFKGRDARLRRDFIQCLEAFAGVKPTLTQRLRERMAALSLREGALAAGLQTVPASVCYWSAGAYAPAKGMLGVAPEPLARSGGTALRTNAGNAVTEWLKEIGLWDQGVHGKQVPRIVFELPRPKLALFLNRLLVCDGSVYTQDRAEIAYATANRELAREVQHLLLRFGVIAQLRERRVRYRGEWRPFYELGITGQDELRRFHEEIGLFGKERVADEDGELRRPVEGDLYWDGIAAIEYLGERRVYDVTVAETHNFVAEDVLVHNTTLAMNIAEHAAIKHQVPAAIFSMEMPGEQLATRMMSSLGRIDQHRVRTGKLEDDDWPRITSAVSILADAPIFVDDTPALTPGELRARCRRLKREHGLGLVIIDYLQLMQVPGIKENRAIEISEISRALKALARELNVPVIALSQLNRSLEQRPDKRPRMADLRECVTGETRVMLANGSRVPIRELVGKRPRVWAVSTEGRVVAATSDRVWPVGTRPVVRVALASGRSIRATAEHRLAGAGGWVRITELKVGDRIAIARCGSEPVSIVHRPEGPRALIGQWVASKSYPCYRPPRYPTSSEDPGLVAAGYGSSWGDDEPRAWVETDLYWDRVVDLRSDGEEEVFDLTVPGPSSWLADGIVSHNSGAIEQDADVIVFIYRDEVYNPESADKGSAEIIIAKQRNGPTGMLRLTFLGQYTRFENYAESGVADGF
jgi:replicative DNA helicase